MKIKKGKLVIFLVKLIVVDKNIDMQRFIVIRRRLPSLDSRGYTQYAGLSAKGTFLLWTDAHTDTRMQNKHMIRNLNCAIFILSFLVSENHQVYLGGHSVPTNSKSSKKNGQINENAEICHHTMKITLKNMQLHQGHKNSSNSFLHISWHFEPLLPIKNRVKQFVVLNSLSDKFSPTSHLFRLKVRTYN